MNKMMVAVVMAALLLVALLPAVLGAGSDQDAQAAPRTEQHAEKGYSEDDQSRPILRPHPRGLPRTGVRDRRDPESRS